MMTGSTVRLSAKLENFLLQVFEFSNAQFPATFQVGDTLTSLETRMVIGFPADTWQINRTLLDYR